MELRAQAAQALRSVLDTLSAEAPLVVCIEDLHWRDPDSSALLQQLLRPPAAPAILLAVSSADDGEALADVLPPAPAPAPAAEQSPARTGQLRAYTGEPRAHTGQRRTYTEPATTGPAPRGDLRLVHLSALSLGESLSLARQRLSRQAPQHAAQAEAIAREAQGLPLFIDEMVRYVCLTADAEAKPWESMRARGAELRLDDVIRARVSDLPPPAAALLEAIALAGQPVDVSVVAAAAAVGTRADRALRVLEALRFVRVRPRGAERLVTCAHDRICSVAADSVSPERQQKIHAGLAQALQGQRAAPESAARHLEVLARHLELSGDAGEALRCYRGAAGAAREALAFGRAAELYARCVELSPVDAPERWKLQQAQADALAAAGHGPDAARLLLDVASRRPAEAARRLRQRAAEALLRSGHVARGRQVLDEVLAEFGQRVPRTRLGAIASIYWHRLRVWWRGLRYAQRERATVPPALLREADACFAAGYALSMVDLLRGGALQARSVLLALKTGVPASIAQALSVAAAVRSLEGAVGRRRAAALWERVEALNAAAGDPLAAGWAHLSRAIADMNSGRWGECLAHSHDAEEVFRAGCPDKTWEIETAHMYRLAAMQRLGRLAELREVLPDLLTLARQRGDLHGEAHFRLGIVAQPALLDGQPVQAEQDVIETLDRWGQRDFDLQHSYALLARMNYSLYRGRGELALRHAAERLPQLQRALLLRVPLVAVDFHDARARAALRVCQQGAGGRAELRLLRASLKSLRSLRLDWPSALADAVQAQVHWLQGSREVAAQGLAAAAARLRSLEMPLLAAAAELRVALMKGNADAAEAARAELRAQTIHDPDAWARMLVPGGPPDERTR